MLHTISSIDQPTLNKAATTILKGLSTCIKGPSPLRNEIFNTPDFWSLLRTLQGQTEVASSIFALVANAVTGQPSSVTADNYEAIVPLLDHFASAGRVGAVTEQKQDKNARKAKGSKPATPRLGTPDLYVVD